MSLPKDPVMLLSAVNMKLRDDYSSLAALCEDLEENEESLKEILSALGYGYDEEKNQFVSE